MEREETIREPYGGSLSPREPSYPYPVSRIGWGAVIAGFFIATVTQILLNSLGFAIGLTAVDPQMDTSGTALGIGAGIWTLVTSLISVFIGAWVAGRYTSIRERGEGPLQGALVWSLSLLFVVWIAAMGIGSALGGLMGLVGQGVSAGVEGAVSQMGQGESAPSADIGRGAGPGETESGSMNREQFIQSLMNNANMSREQAENIANQMGLSSVNPQQLQQQAQQAATTTAKFGAAAAWWFFITALLSLGAAIWGGQIGFKRTREVRT